jgi:flagellum-specific peptidoglycan hydrolase FlgJ
MRKTVITATILLASISCYGQTIAEVKAEIIRQHLPHPEIVLAQARLETGNFTSVRCKRDKNILGIKHGTRYAKYRRWQDCVTDYKRRISSRYKGGDYYAFLRRIGYARDARYTNKVSNIVRTSKQ